MVGTPFSIPLLRDGDSWKKPLRRSPCGVLFPGVVHPFKRTCFPELFMLEPVFFQRVFQMEGASCSSGWKKPLRRSPCGVGGWSGGLLGRSATRRPYCDRGRPILGVARRTRKRLVWTFYSVGWDFIGKSLLFA